MAVNTINRIEESANKQRKLLEGAREVDQFGRRLERFLLMQLQQLEMAISAFDRERAAWQRKQESEVSQLEQNKKALAESWEQLKKVRADAQRSKSTWWSRPSAQESDPDVETSPAISHGQASRPVQSAAIAQQSALSSNASAPLRMLLKPGTASEFWLGAMMVEISKLNWQLGGTGVRFEPVSCHLRGGNPRSQDAEGFTQAIVEVEIFSCTPVMPTKRERSLADSSRSDLLNWERFKSLLVMSSLVDQPLAKTFKKSSLVARNHEFWQKVAKAARRAEGANAKLRTTVLHVGTTNDANDATIQQQVKRIEVMTGVISKEHDSRVHLSLV